MLEMKATVSALLRHYKLSLEDTNEPQPFVLELVMKSLNGTRLKLEPRA
jgi:cytochrome P450